MFMKIFGAIVFLLLAAGFAAAGEIYGTVTEADKPLPAGVSVRLACGSTTAEAATDGYGAYSVKVGATGKCMLSIPSLPGGPSLAVNVYEKSARYDLAVSRAGGKATLSRK
jgi:hypothetical protein